MIGTDAGRGEELARRTDDLERTRGELERLVSIASHDLREPMRAISGFSELLERELADEMTPRAKEFLALIQQGTLRMNALLDGLSAYGRAGRSTAEPGPVDMDLAIDQVLVSMRDEIAARAAEITRDPLPVVRADQRGIQELLRHLIANAIKFNERPAPHVHVSAAGRDRTWELTVADDGIGVPERERDRVFEIFRRLHPRDAYEGAGVGLAVCQRIVQRHGGRIWVDEAPGGGSVLHVLLPAENVGR